MRSCRTGSKYRHALPINTLQLAHTAVCHESNATGSSRNLNNDVTHDELVTLVKQVALIDTSLADAHAHGSLRLVASGNGAPLIDLTQLSSQLCMAVIEAEVDLVILEGMGRAIETNLQSRFTCDVLKLAMIKDHGVAEALGGSLFDLALRYEPLV